MSEIKQYVDFEALDRFNQLINIRYQGRFKYIGEFELNADFADFDVLAPAHVGDVYHAKEGTVDEITFGEMTIKAGDWFVVMNESRVGEDGKIRIYDENLDHAPYALGHVSVEKLGSQMDDLVAYGYYNALNSIAPYAYEAHYDDLNYPYAYKNFDDVVASTGGCSAVRVGNSFGRNLDWIYNEQVDFVVHTNAKGGRYATLGLCGQIAKLDREFVASKDYASEYVLLPFYCVDGINEKHVFVSMNVMPDDPATPEEIVPAGEVYASICANMIPRYVLDYCGSADEAVEVITNHLKIHFSTKAREGGFLPHYLIGDVNKTYIVEYVGGDIVATLQNNTSAVMTNFRIAGTTPNADDKYNTPEDKASGAPSVVNGLDLHAAGVERFNFAKSAIGLGTDVPMIMKDLWYTNTYRDSTSPFWYSEYVGIAGTTIDSNPSDFDMIVDVSKEVFANRSRDPESDYYGTWQSKHTCVYDVDGLKLTASFQEQEDVFEFEITAADALPEGENDGDALIYVNGQWRIMPKYGYMADAGDSYETSLTMSKQSDDRYYGEFDRELNFVEGQTYEVRIGDEAPILVTSVLAKDYPSEEQESGNDVILYVEDSFEIRKSAGGTSYIISTVGDDANPVDISIRGQFVGDTIKIDEKYIDKIIEEVDVLPTEDKRNENRIYKILTPWRKIAAYNLTSDAADSGWTIDADGLHGDSGDFTWDEVNFSWDTYSDLLTMTSDGPVYRFGLKGYEDKQILYRADGEEEPTVDNRICLYIYDDVDEVFKEIYNSDTSVVGGADNYANLRNKPKINGVTLENDKTSTELKIAVNLTQAEYNALVEGNNVDPETLYCITDGTSIADIANYELLDDKPSIEGVELRKGMSYEDLGLMGRSEIESKLSSFLTFRGSVATLDDLPDDAERGDVYFVEALQRNYAYNGLQWYDMGGTVDMSIYQKKQGDTLTTTNKSIEGAINELDSLKLEKKPDGLETEANTVVGAINELKERMDEAAPAPLIYLGSATAASGTLDGDQVEELKRNHPNTMVQWNVFFFTLAYHSGNTYWFRALQTDTAQNFERSRTVKIDSDTGAWTMSYIELEPKIDVITVTATSGDLTDAQVATLKKNRNNMVLYYAGQINVLSKINGAVYSFSRILYANETEDAMHEWTLDTSTKKYSVKVTTLPIARSNPVTVTSTNTNSYTISNVTSYQVGKMINLSFVVTFKVAVSGISLQTVASVNKKPVYDCTGNSWYSRSTAVANTPAYFNAACGINRNGSVFFDFPYNTKVNANDTTFCNFTYFIS